MSVTSFRRLALLAAICAAWASPASADIVRLAHGRTMTVDGCRFEGDTVILLLPGGGEVRAHKDLVIEILPEEIPRGREIALERLALSPSAARVPPEEGSIRLMVDRVAARVGIDARLAHAVDRPIDRTRNSVVACHP